MATKLSLYKGALRALGERSISSLTEARPPRYVLDQIWDGDGGDGGIRDLALSEGYWNFALRTIKVEYDAAVTPAFGFTRAFSKPSDWLSTAAVASEEYFTVPYNLYADEQDYWFSDLDTMYFKIVSKGEDYGYNLTKWPMNFTRYVEHLMAMDASSRLANSASKKSEMLDLADYWLSRAKSSDAMNQPTERLPSGSFVSSRRGGNGSPTRTSGGWLF